MKEQVVLFVSLLCSLPLTAYEVIVSLLCLLPVSFSCINFSYFSLKRWHINNSIQKKDNRNRKKEIMVMNHHPSSNEFAETP